MPATLDDVARGDRPARRRSTALDLGRVVAIGHSAGGHLAAWAATREHPRVPLTGVVSQAGVLDLERARELRLSDGVVDAFLGGARRRASPRRSSGSRSACRPCSTHGGARRHRARCEISQRVRRARAARRCVVEPDEDHFGHLDPATRCGRR